MKLFIAKFSTIDSASAPLDVNGILPLRTEVLAGTANAYIVNGTLFQKGKFTENMIYLCTNYVDAFNRPQVRPLVSIPLLELKEVCKNFGEPVYNLNSNDESFRNYKCDCGHVGDNSRY